MYNLRYGSDLSLTCKKLCMFLNYKTLGSARSVSVYQRNAMLKLSTERVHVCLASPRRIASPFDPIRFDSLSAIRHSFHCAASQRYGNHQLQYTILSDLALMVFSSLLPFKNIFIPFHSQANHSLSSSTASQRVGRAVPNRVESRLHSLRCCRDRSRRSSSSSSFSHHHHSHRLTHSFTISPFIKRKSTIACWKSVCNIHHQTSHHPWRLLLNGYFCCGAFIFIRRDFITSRERRESRWVRQLETTTTAQSIH